MIKKDISLRLMLPAGLALFLGTSPFSPLMVGPMWATLMVGILGLAIGSVLMMGNILSAASRQPIPVPVRARTGYAGAAALGRRQHH